MTKPYIEITTNILSSMAGDSKKILSLIKIKSKYQITNNNEIIIF